MLRLLLPLLLLAIGLAALTTAAENENVADNAAAVQIDATAANETAIDSSDCPPYFFRLVAGGKCYYFVTAGFTWDWAAIQCQALHSNAHLAMIESVREQDAISLHLRGLTGLGQCNAGVVDGPNKFYIAGQRLIVNDCNARFVWKIPEHLPLTYTSWDTGHKQPTCTGDGNGRKQSCIAMNRSVNGNWDDVYCYKTFCSICEVYPQGL